MPSEHLDDLLLSLSRVEFRDVIGVDAKLAKQLIILFNHLTKMLDYEIKAREINKFMPIMKLGCNL